MTVAGASTHEELLRELIQKTFLFRPFQAEWLGEYIPLELIQREKFFSSRTIYTAYKPGQPLETLYAVVAGGPVIVRSTPLDRVIAITYPGGCFGMRNLAVGYGTVRGAFPCAVEAYKTTHVISIAMAAVHKLYSDSPTFRQRYDFLFELREKFEYHLLNCSAYPPQAVAALLRGLIYQERELGSQPDADGVFHFDLPIDIIARACQLNGRTVEQVLKGLQQIGIILPSKEDRSNDWLRVVNPELLKEIYATTRDKVDWWPLR
ncbi:MAG: hypothetical protein Q6J68_05310 [Thermostichales cyanobacterium SZTDM-1c_bins_54]